MGTVLGDGYILKTTMGYCLRIKHSNKQKNLVEWKHRILANIATPPKIYGNQCYFRTVTHPTFAEYRKLFYRGKRKVVSEKLSSLIDPVALATWIMDDGTNELGKTRSLRINTQSFTLPEQKRLQRILRANFGITTTLNRDKQYYRLRVAKDSMEALRKIVAPYVIPEMLYKISP